MKEETSFDVNSKHYWTLLNEMICIADTFYDGHFTILKFTTNWRADFGTPFHDDIVEDTSDGFQPVGFRSFKEGKTVTEAMTKAIAWHKARHEKQSPESGDLETVYRNHIQGKAHEAS